MMMTHCLPSLSKTGGGTQWWVLLRGSWLKASAQFTVLQHHSRHTSMVHHISLRITLLVDNACSCLQNILEAYPAYHDFDVSWD
jgi:hypothetical protein